jgi:ribosome biogenesis GTPase
VSLREGTVVRLYSDAAAIALTAEDGGHGEVVAARLRGRLELDSDEGEKSPLVVGDRVRLELDGDDAIVEERLPRRSKLSRPHPHNPRVEQVIAANVDQVLVVASPVMPPFRSGLLDRYLIAAAAHGLRAALALTKCDLVDQELADALVEPYRAIGLPIFSLRHDDPASIERLRCDFLEGHATVLVGQSGTGKTTLRNMLLPAQARAVTAPVSLKTTRGVHATTAATFEPLPPRGFLVDTPGSRQLGLWDVEPEQVQRYFPEFAGLECRFRDCRHEGEPGCRVLAAVERGRACAERLASLIAIRRSLE